MSPALAAPADEFRVIVPAPDSREWTWWVEVASRSVCEFRKAAGLLITRHACPAAPRSAYAKASIASRPTSTFTSHRTRFTSDAIRSASSGLVRLLQDAARRAGSSLSEPFASRHARGEEDEMRPCSPLNEGRIVRTLLVAVGVASLLGSATARRIVAQAPRPPDVRVSAVQQFQCTNR